MHKDQQNSGFQVFGGTINAKNIAIGTDAQITNNNYPAEERLEGQPDHTSAVPASINVLLVQANPQDSRRLSHGSEMRAIQEAIALSRFRDTIKLTLLPAATIHDLRRALLKETFQIIHMAGHGSPHGFMLENIYGQVDILSQEAMSTLFNTYQKEVQCVILNACGSFESGKQIAREVASTIAMKNVLNDSAAIEFSRGFYDALGAGKPIDFAYAEGCRTVKLTVPDVAFEAVLIPGKASRI